MNRFDPANQLRLLERRHSEALAFIDHMGMRIRYDEWMAVHGLASEFTTEVLGLCPHGVDLDRELCPQGCRV